MPPAKAPSRTGTPSTKAPSMSPWQKLASAEPPLNARSQARRNRPARKRYSKATPRKISANSMTISGT